MATPTKSETEDLKDQVATLKADVTELVSLLGSTASNTASRTAQDLTTEIARVKDELRDKTETAYARTEEHITSNPIQSIMMAVGVGFLIGAMSRR